MKNQIRMCETQKLQGYKYQAPRGVSAAVNYKMGSLLARTAGHVSQLLLRK